MMAARWLIILVCCLICLVFSEDSEISNKRLCADTKCEVTISACRAVQRHVKTHKDMLVFSEGDEILVKSKGAGSRPDLWGGELNGKHGYFPKYLVQETKVFEKDLKFSVSTVEHTEDGDDLAEVGDTEDEDDADPTDLDDDDDTTTDKPDDDDEDIALFSDQPDTDKTADVSDSDNTEVMDELTDLDDDQIAQDVQTDKNTEDAVNSDQLGDRNDDTKHSLEPETNAEELNDLLKAAYARKESDSEDDRQGMLHTAMLEKPTDAPCTLPDIRSDSSTSSYPEHSSNFIDSSMKKSVHGPDCNGQSC
ncbi:hypothetical protein LSH36_154g04012, partial [Paralvinella palmiformis]